jgi:hypothetical protein
MIGGVFGFGAVIGGMCGMVLGPLASFGFLRRVPLGRLFGQAAFGATVGGVAGVLSPFGHYGPYGALGVATAGFVLASARLAWVYRGNGTTVSLPPVG